MTPARLCWYGDDFTGATDTLAVLTQAGLRAMLFLGVPDAAQEAAAVRAVGGPLDAIGIAGASRTMAPAALRAELEPVGAFFGSTGAPVLHYKVCSTFDSAPALGSIGAAARILREHVENRLVAIVGGQPSLGRYCAFSNLFAAAGRGGEVERLDRHPTMRSHPATPMREADLRRHLTLQGMAPVAGFHYPWYAQPAAAQAIELNRLLSDTPDAVLFDVAEPAHLASVGRLIWEQAQRKRMLAIGSSGLAQALVAHWQAGQHAAAPAGTLPAADSPVLVFAGSQSPVTARQVHAARSFRRVVVTPGQLIGNEAGDVTASISDALRDGQNVLICTAPADSGAADGPATGIVAAASARFVHHLLQAQADSGRPLRRVGIAGGDTSSLAVKALDFWGLSYAGELGPGVTVCRGHSDHPALNGLEMMLKGGQMGAENVFEQLLEPGAANRPLH